MNRLPSQLLAPQYPDLALACGASLDAAFGRIAEGFAGGHKLLLCGNGGSGADCEHIAAELIKGFRLPRPLPAALRDRLGGQGDEHGHWLGQHLQAGLPVCSLVSGGALLSAIANDLDPRLLFAQQVVALGRPGDVLLAISTSGTSDNVLSAVKTAQVLGLQTVGLTGPSGGQLAGQVDVVIRAPGKDVAQIQEAHLPLYHALCTAVEAAFFGFSPTHTVPSHQSPT